MIFDYDNSTLRTHVVAPFCRIWLFQIGVPVLPRNAVVMTDYA